MGSEDPRKQYASRLALWSAAIAQEESRHLVVSNLRLACLAVAAFLLWLGLGRAVVSPAWTLVPLGAFLALLVVHARVLNARDRAVRPPVF